ncbi:MAG: uracil-xanthine permease family protein [Desulfoplanes sp.]|nr:uracil-xanthine permease family protein [Desulfoplanes sp.]
MAVKAPTDYDFRFKDCLLGGQMLFVAFGALVLVPLLTGLDPNVALCTAGLGTLVFQVITKRKVPIFLASSFAFIAPIIYGVQTWGIPSTMCGLAAAGLFYVVLSLFISWRGTDALARLLPPVVTGPVIMVIGLVLAPVAVHMAMGRTGDGAVVLIPEKTALIISMVSLCTTVVASVFGKGIFRLIPILCAIVVGFIASLVAGIVDFSEVAAAPWFAVPHFTFPVFNWQAILFIVPVAIAPAIEHFGDIVAISSITGKNYLQDPGVNRTMLGDGLATSLASFLGGPPNTTYSEVTGAVALVKIFNPAIMTWAAILAIALSFVGKVGAFLHSIPGPVMGGIMILLFGTIMVVGINNLVKAQIDLMKARNLAIVALIVIFGVGGMAFSAGNFTVKGIGLAGIMGVFLNMILPGRE